MPRQRPRLARSETPKRALDDFILAVLPYAADAGKVLGEAAAKGNIAAALALASLLSKELSTSRDTRAIDAINELRRLRVGEATHSREPTEDIERVDWDATESSSESKDGDSPVLGTAGVDEPSLANDQGTEIDMVAVQRALGRYRWD